MIVLAIDTALGATQAGVFADGHPLAIVSEAMERGHQERLAPAVQAAMRAAGTAFAKVDRIAVTVGPGSFTGLRVGLAFAKGLALALDRPCIGVGVLEALARSVTATGLVAGALTARPGPDGAPAVYVQAFRDGVSVLAPDQIEVDVAAVRLIELGAAEGVSLIGSGGASLSTVLPHALLDLRPAPDIAAVAAIGARGTAPFPPPRPLYLRGPDARTLAERRAAAGL